MSKESDRYGDEGLDFIEIVEKKPEEAPKEQPKEDEKG
jgi:hypothetical protein